MRKSIFLFLFIVFPAVGFAKNYWQGPVGGTGGNYFQTVVADHERVCGVYIRHGSRIDAIQLKVCDKSGNSYRSQRFGGGGGSESFFAISSAEYLSGLKVYLGRRDGGERIFGLQLEKNRIGSSSSSTRVTSPLYGTKTTKLLIQDGVSYQSISPFDYSVPGIVGLFGRANKELDAVGLVFSDGQRGNDPDNLLRTAIGGKNGVYDDFFQFTDGNICRFDVRHGSRIDGLRFKKCTDNGGSLYSPWYGGSGGSISSFILQDGEFLVAIRGSLVTRNGRVTLSSIYFVTNKRVSPIFGETTSREYKVEIPVGKAVYLLQVESKDEITSLGVWTL
ncbi:jacalin-like lectin [Microbulbifer harenosus]|uniref:Jacalin-type lectin domain-containing protein n=1 Tax=Microbulbifer harenosus TaxID=2576840 RepID=A0ABY2UIB0_9GAMM|nr:hypothetical protein [Microbulbifer harenosus]TLM77318.1 hypothetical protein FDY93_10335 [Microbulbifer harenosus]